jgi:hypothetical protein
MHFLALIPLAFLFATPISFATPVMMPRHHNPSNLGNMKRHHGTLDSTNGDHFILARAPPADHAKSALRRRAANRCASKNSTSTTTPSAPKNIGNQPRSSSSTSTSTSSSSSSSPTNTPTKVQPRGYWPSKTQSGDTYSATVATPADPNLLSISDALNNDNNPLFQNTHTGDLTYYQTGIVACGDTYTDTTLTAAIAHGLWDSWPGAGSDTTRSPVCGPYTPGRKLLNTAAEFYDGVSSSVGYTWIGGDGLPSCDPSSKIQCHIPLTATITNPANGKSVSGVKIVDKCAGCAGSGDIDVTQTLFEMLGDVNAGRISGIQWKFDQY